MTAVTFVTLGEAAKAGRTNDKRMYDEHPGKLDKVLYQTRQWSVTEYGLENHRGPYHYYIPWADVRPTPEGAHGWEEHMAEKNWVDAGSFNDAFAYAVQMKIKGYTPPVRDGGDTQ